MITLKAIAVWFALLVCAVLNGALREALLVPALDKPMALVVSGLLLSAVVLGLAILAAPWLGKRTTAQHMLIGALWLGLTVGFEFSFGRLVQHQSWQQLLQVYTFSEGNLWPLVLAVIFIAPWLAARMRGLA